MSHRFTLMLILSLAAPLALATDTPSTSEIAKDTTINSAEKSIEKLSAPPPIATQSDAPDPIKKCLALQDEELKQCIEAAINPASNPSAGHS